jgi:hypothetical protein
MAHCRLSKRQKRTKTHPAKLLVMCHCLTLKTVSEMSTEININGLLEKPLWQMTGEEYCQLTQYALSLSNGTGTTPSPSGQKALGVHALAVELGCSDSTIYALMRTPREDDGSSEGGGVLKDAIVSRIGRRIVFDVDKARELAKQSQQR